MELDRSAKGRREKAWDLVAAVSAAVGAAKGGAGPAAEVLAAAGGAVG